MDEMQIATLGDRMKKYEDENTKPNIRPCDSFIVRLDGRSFSKFTKRLVKPFDILFVKAMCLTTKDLVKEFDAQTGYTHSDEITLIFNSKCSNDEFLDHMDYFDRSKNGKCKCRTNIYITNHLFNGRIHKILSLISSYCSVRFNYHLEKLIEPVQHEYDVKFIELVQSHKQMFDSRILVFDEFLKYEVLNHQIWRSVQDCYRNAITAYAHTYFGYQKIMNKKSTEMIEMLKNEKNLDWNDETQIPLFIKHGLYCKKIKIQKKVGDNVAIRTECAFAQYKINYSEDNLNVLLSKYWDNIDTWGGRIVLDELAL
jgi:tRNA(His) guanylyltransferase